MAELQRTQVQVNQRTDAVDHNRIATFQLSNLFLALKNFLTPGSGVVRPGRLVPAGGLSLTLEAPVSGIVSGGEAVMVDEDLAIGPLSNADATHPRIDLIQIAYAINDTDTEQRFFVNPADGSKFQSSVDTTKTVQPVVSIKTGTPAATPTAPSPDAGALALWEVTVPAGAGSISESNISVAPDAVGSTLLVVPIVDDAAQTLSGEWRSSDTGPNLRFSVPAGRYALLLAHLTVQPIINDSLANAVTATQPLAVQFREVGGTYIGAPTYQNIFHIRDDVGGGSPYYTVNHFTVLSGLIATKEYELSARKITAVLNNAPSWTSMLVDTPPGGAADASFMAVLIL